MSPTLKLTETMKKNYASLHELDLRNVYVIVCAQSLKAPKRGVTASEVKDMLLLHRHSTSNVADSLKKLEVKQLIVSTQEKQIRYYLPKELARGNDSISSSLISRFNEAELSKLSKLVFKTIERAPMAFDDIYRGVQKNEVGALTADEVRVIIGALIADGAVVEMTTNIGVVYRTINSSIYTYCPSYNQVPGHQGMHLSLTPCCKCPHLHVCSPHGAISPEQCVYITQWLNSTE